ncbi:mechanosensitive ion channel family protein [Psychrobacter sp. FDAARGOS_221]|uniref:mechanosensitive ion channel family protein n=1 Tax=Psychrobacter sp. FDAARGOS_221 TaxID=1975705 RepID=UPI000BB58089|nr:mechanosensitive ion channel family protein [Psychrobacter sp. FDAARGOS_221]PNK59518.1 mechanosensitive ion channel family protein [Psychrobacter sp. FDAARGOS_221]
MDIHLKSDKSRNVFYNLLALIMTVLIVVGGATFGGLSSSYAETSQSQQQTKTDGSSQTSSQDSDESQEESGSLMGYIKDSLDLYGSNESEKEEEEEPYLTHNLQATNELTGEYNEAYFVVNKLNSGLPQPNISPNLETPLSTLEFFNAANIRKDFALASYALNLNSFDEGKQVNIASDLVRKLDYLLNEKDLYVFDDVPDRADGLVEPSLGSTNPIEGIPRRAIKLGSIDYKNRSMPIYLERVKVEGQPPVWVFSSQTVMSIEMLYDIHKPAYFERYIPDWLLVKVFGLRLWEVLAMLVFMAVTMGLGLLMSKGAAKAIKAYSDRKLQQVEENELSLHGKGITDLFSKITAPLTVFISFLLMFALVSGSLPKVSAIATSLRPIIWIGLIISALWLGVRGTNFFADRYQDHQIDTLTEKEFNIQRIRMTYVSIFRRVFIFVIVLGGLWISLAEFTDLEGLGKTLMTSAGIAGVIIGIAAQPTLGNIIAGFQVALTQPVRIGDTVMLNDIWCEVEDLRYTYAVLKTWDDRRLIIPMKNLVTEIVENWSHTSSTQSSCIYLYVDYGADIDSIEKKFVELAQAHELCSEEIEPQMQVTGVTETTIILRGKLTADSPINAFNLECDIRKQMLDYLGEQHTDHLPTDRITLAPRASENS